MIEVRIESMAGEIVSTGNTHLAAIGNVLLKLDIAAECRKIPMETVCAILEAAHEAACNHASGQPAVGEAEGLRVLFAERDA